MTETLTLRGPQVCSLAGVTYRQLDSPTVAENIAWAAGLWEGEGSLFWHTANNGPRMQMSSTDLDVLERFLAVVECGRVYGPYVKAAPARLPRYDWITGGQVKTRRLCAAFWPFLGQRRRAKVVEVLGDEF